MTETLPVICAYGFDDLGLHRMEGFVGTNNLNCKKAMAKLDFTHKGTMQGCKLKNGNYLSIDLYAKINVNH